MMNSFQLVAFITFGFLVHSTTVNGLSCYECDSADNVSTCGETLGVNHQIELSNCSAVQDVAYCIKHTGLSEVSNGGLQCFVCSSVEDRHCPEYYPEFHHVPLNFTVTRDWYPVPKSCKNIYDARYCIKTTGFFGGQVGTKRFCSSKDYGNFCEWVTRPGDDRKFRACVYTCSSNACNGAFSRHQVSHLSYTLASLLYGAIMFLRY